MYVDSERIDYYGKLNTNTSNIYTKKPSGHNETMLNCVTGKGYNIIIMLVGINEVGNNTAAYIDAYRKVAEKVMNDNPEAQFVIHAMLPISASASNQNRYGVTNQNINIKNEALKNLADEIGCGFVDAGVIFRNEYGVLPEGISSDGIHMNKNIVKNGTNGSLKHSYNYNGFQVKMKKTISFILCIFVLLTFVSCGGKDDNNNINNAMTGQILLSMMLRMHRQKLKPKLLLLTGLI